LIRHRCNLLDPSYNNNNYYYFCSHQYHTHTATVATPSAPIQASVT